MDAHKAKRKELDDFHDTFETDEEAIAWMRRYGVFPLRLPRFGVGTDAIRRIREACGSSKPFWRTYAIGQTLG